MASTDDLPTRECPACRATVPAAVFCGRCGSDLKAPAGFWRVLLRPKVFAAEPRHSLLTPTITGSLFPRLAEPARRPFRLALAVLLITIVILSALRANMPMGAVATLGGPLLFVLYMWQSDALRELPVRALVIAAAIGVVTAVAWWFLAGRLLASSYGVTAAGGQALMNVLAGYSLAVTAGGAVLMVLPAVVVRLLRVPVDDGLDGFVIGAFGALAHMVAATITWMMPQIVAGLLDPQSPLRLLRDAITYGVIDPLITVALGGLVGLRLWFRPNPADPHHRAARTALTLCTVSAAILYLGVWTVDAMAQPEVRELTVNLILAVLALLTIRCGVQIALLHGEPDPATGQPVLCMHCEKVVPDMAFCPSCGAAARASSRTSRRLRSESPPVREPSAG